MLSAVLLGLISATIPGPQGGAAGFRADLEALTSCAAAGRLPGSAGDRLVIEHLVRRMRELELGPLPGLEDGHLQRFAARDPRPRRYDPERTSLRLHLPNGCDDAAVGTEAWPFPGSANGAVTAPVVFAGYGLVVDALGHDDYRCLDVRGKVVLVLRGAPGGRGSRYAEHRSELLFATKMRRALEHGAAGFLLCERWDRQRSSGELDDARHARGRAELPAMWVTRRLARRLMGEEKPGEQPLTTGASVRLRVRMGPEWPDRATANVLGLIRGSDPDLRDEVVVVGAHHDGLGLGAYGSLGGAGAVGRVHPGADDNASGVAGLLELAARLAAAPPSRSVLIAAFGAEEMGAQGSRWLLRDAPFPLRRMVAMVNLDMIGRGRSGVWVEAAGSSPDWRPLLRRAEGYGRPALRVQVRDSSSRRSDHVSFLDREIPAVLFHTGLHAQYHRPTDVPSLVQVEEAVAVVGLAAHVVRTLAEQPARPEFRRER
ncbi:MAG: M20/M25/M40 family metallo-hydrolase [Planctomycetota bacterium]